MPCAAPFLVGNRNPVDVTHLNRYRESMSDQFSEHEFLAWLRGLPSDDRLLIPIGDDAALLDDHHQGILLASDAVVEGTHCEVGPKAAEILSRKVVRSNLSDIAAMGGKAESLLLNMILPRQIAKKASRQILETVHSECQEWQVALAGGDTICAGDRIILSACVTGRPIAEPIKRSGAKVGDLIVVTGSLGGSILGHHSTFIPRLREAEELVRLGPPSAMADISDGFLRDLNNILTSSNVGAIVQAEQIPISPAARALSESKGEKTALDHALYDGEDFELIFTIPPERFALMRVEWNIDTKLTVTGEVMESGLYLSREGEVCEVSPGGFDHGKVKEDRGDE
ncbi:MAG: thiamine-monophosphate kinase [Planctomycetota bacterium]|jgi:thiamine-monophosphate kinase